LVNLEKLVVRTGAACLAASLLLGGVGHLLHWPALLRLAKYIAVAFMLAASLPPLASIAIIVALGWRKRRRWVTKMRSAWDTASHRLGLKRTEGASPYDDRIHGDFDGARVEVTLAKALEGATAAGRFDVVALLAGELTQSQAETRLMAAMSTTPQRLRVTPRS
jgi:hypothetical protein